MADEGCSVCEPHGPATVLDQRGRVMLHGGRRGCACGAVVAAQCTRVAPGKSSSNRRKKATVGAAEPVDRLVGVADGGEVAVGGAQQARGGMGVVDVLVLVDADHGQRAR